MHSGKKETDNLTQPKAITAISPQEKSVLKDLARVNGENYVELPAKWCSPLSSISIRLASLRAATRPPTPSARSPLLTSTLACCVLAVLGSPSPKECHSHFGCDSGIPQRGFASRTNCRLEAFNNPLHRAVYGLREVPSLWSQERTAVMEKMRFRCRGESFKVVISEIHRSICLLVRERGVLKGPSMLLTEITQRVQPFNILALCGIYVDDYLAMGPKDVVNAFFEHLRMTWKTTDPVFLNPGINFNFLGITLEIATLGLLLHQKTYTEALLS